MRKIRYLFVSVSVAATICAFGAVPSAFGQRRKPVQPATAGSPEDVRDCRGVANGPARILDCGCNLECTPTPIPVYIFSNVFFPVSSVDSSKGFADTSITLTTEFDQRVAAQVGDTTGTFRSFFDQMKAQGDKRALNWDRWWGDWGRKKTLVIAADGTFVGAFDTSTFLAQNPGFTVGDTGTVAGIKTSYNTYKGRIIDLPGASPKVKVVLNATASPLIIDLNGDGAPSLLGSGWSKSHAATFDLTAYRVFNFVGHPAKSWEWIGPEDGLLVWLPSLPAGVAPDSRALFGTDTWGKRWEHGFEPLATLDKDRDSLVQDEELREVGVWQDTNGDAIPQADEVITAVKAGISAISTEAKGAPEAPRVLGGVDVKGVAVDIWDWWSAGNPLTGLHKVGALEWTAGSVPGVMVASFMPLAEEGSFPMLPGGEIEIYQDDGGEWFVRVMAKAQDGTEINLLYPATSGAGMLRWGMRGGDITTSHAIFEADGEPSGITAMSDGRFATWKVGTHSGASPWRLNAPQEEGKKS